MKILNIKKEKWEIKKEIEIPKKMQLLKAILIGEYIHLIGGYNDEEYLATHYIIKLSEILPNYSIVNNPSVLSSHKNDDDLKGTVRSLKVCNKTCKKTTFYA